MIMSVISLRLKEGELNKLNELSLEEKKDKSTVARELIQEGWNFLMIRQYRQGKLSLGALAQRLDLSLSETIDTLSDLGVQAPIEYEDYLKGLSVLQDAAAQP
jgi:predicted HTH domain antitoxin